MTQQRAAELAGLEPNSIWRYENAQREPSASTLNTLGLLYSKPVEWFFGEDAADTTTGKDDGDDIDIADPDLSLFFRGEWDTFTEDEKDFIKGMIRESRELLRKRRETGNADN